MPYGRPANVRSHRRGGPRRRLAVAPWIVIGLVTVLVLSGVTVGYLRLVRESCTGETRATIAASPSMVQLLDGLARTWSEEEPAVGGVCAAVDVESADSVAMSELLGQAWDDKRGKPPDVWVPESSAWVRKASARTQAETMMPDLQPSIARTPAVVAMPRPMAEALKWPDLKMSWQDLVEKYAAKGWADSGKPEWGEFKLGMSNPETSTAGLLALMAMLDANDDGEVVSSEQATIARLKQVRDVYEDSSDKIFAALKKEDAQGSNNVLTFLSAFPALEQEILTYNLGNPKIPLVAVYPSNGSGEADHPYLVLNAPWSDQKRQKVAESFLQFVRGPEGRAAVLAAGFRDSNRAAGKPLSAGNGLAEKITTLPRAVLLPESVRQSVEVWTAATRQASVLLVLDVSGSMNEDVLPNTGRKRLALAKEAAIASVKLFSEDTHVGLWIFSTKQNGNIDHRELVSVGKLTEPAGAGKNRRDVLIQQINGLTARGNTGLYDTAINAFTSMQAKYRVGAANLVVLMTDGKNEDDSGGVNLAQVREQVARDNGNPEKQVRIITVGFGTDADFAALKEISAVSGAQSYQSREGYDIPAVLQSAIFGPVV